MWVKVVMAETIWLGVCGRECNIVERSAWRVEEWRKEGRKEGMEGRKSRGVVRNCSRGGGRFKC